MEYYKLPVMLRLLSTCLALQNARHNTIFRAANNPGARGRCLQVLTTQLEWGEYCLRYDTGEWTR